MGKVFISYRRDDAAGYARAIYEALTERFSRDRIFMDVDTIEPGLPFDEVIRDAVGQSEVLLVLIGPRWLVPDVEGHSRLEDERDFVRLEVAAALARNIRVIPVLLDGTPMPAETALPEPLRGLAWRNALEVSNSRFSSDIERLTNVLARVLEDRADPAGAPADQAQAGASAVSAVSGVPAPAATTGVHAEAEPSVDQSPTPPERAASAGGGLRHAIGAGVLVAVAVLAWSLWPTGRSDTPDAPDTSGPVIPDATPATDFEARPWGVVFGSDRTVAAARDELFRASRNGVEDTGLYLRNGYYTSIALRADRTEANRVLGVVRSFRADAYVADMRTWCLRPVPREGYVECQAGGARN